MSGTHDLADLAAKLDRLLDDRVHWYRAGVKKGTLALEAAAEKQSEIEAIRRQFRWLVANAWWLRPVAAQRQSEIAAALGTRIDHVVLSVPVDKPPALLSTDERARLASHPSVAAVREAFPAATPSASQPIKRPVAPATGESAPTDPEAA